MAIHRNQSEPGLRCVGYGPTGKSNVKDLAIDRQITPRVEHNVCGGIRVGGVVQGRAVHADVAGYTDGALVGHEQRGDGVGIAGGEIAVLCLGAVQDSAYVDDVAAGVRHLQLDVGERVGEAGHGEIGGGRLVG